MELDFFSSASEPGRECGFLLLLAFLISFSFIRTSARLMRSPRVPWWPGSVEAGGVHIHHLVWGISLVLVSGFAAFVSDLYSPWWQVTSIAFGIGAGLTLDEFALWVYLRDVYWSAEGRDSIDAVILVTLLAGLVVLGVQPFDLDQTGAAVGTTGAVVVVLGLSTVTFLKGRLLLGAISIFVPVVGLVAAVRLAKPNSPWARRRYRGRRAHRLERATARHERDTRLNAMGVRIRDAIGGAPTPEDEKTPTKS
jgi:hypothetical protein